MDCKIEDVEEAKFIGAMMRSMVALERVEVVANLLTISSDDCDPDEDNQLYKECPFEFSNETDQDLCFALKSPVKIVFGLASRMRSKISSGIGSAGRE